MILFIFRAYKGLTNIVKEEKARKVTLGGRGDGQLKEKTIKRLTSYYKKAIHRNKGNVQVTQNKPNNLKKIIFGS